MRAYYHRCPTCPTCQEPHRTGAELVDLDDGFLRCSSCGSHFRSGIDLMGSEHFLNTVRGILDRGTFTEDELNSFRTIWRFVPNPIESAYIHWLLNECPRGGRFLITWPWRSPKFVPVLLFEYLLKFPDRRAVVITRLVEGASDDGVIGPVTIRQALRDLIVIEDPNLDALEQDMRREMNKFKEKAITRKGRVTHYVITRTGEGRSRVEGHTDRPMEEILREIIDELRSDYQDDPVRSVIERRLNRDWSRRGFGSKEGFIDIVVDEREQWLAKMHCKRTWQWEALLGTRPPVDIQNVLDRITVVDQDGDVRDNLGRIDEIAPDILVIDDADSLLKDHLFWKGPTGRQYLEHINGRTGTLTLMFSTHLDFRHRYELHKRDGRVCRYDVIPHTWDSGMVHERIEGMDWKGPGQPNPLSSMNTELPRYGRAPYVEYRTVPNLEKLDEMVAPIETLGLAHQSMWDVRNYVRDLKRTTLYPMAHASDPVLFQRRGRTWPELTLESILIRINQNDGGEEVVEEVQQIVGRFFGTPSEGRRNPFLDSVIEHVDRYLDDHPSCVVTVVVHGMDVRGTRTLFKERGHELERRGRLAVCSWRQLTGREKGIDAGTEHRVISVMPPNIEYKLYGSPVDKFLFLGTEEMIERTKKIISNRLVEERVRPLVFLSDKDEAPALLHKLQEELEPVPEKEVLQITEELEFESGLQRSGTSCPGAGRPHSIIKEGETAVLIIGPGDRGMFVPIGTTLFVKDETGLDEVDLDEKSKETVLIEKLQRKDLVLDMHDTYISFRSIFTGNMFVHGRDITFKRGPFHWEGFKVLFQDSVRWIDVLEEVLSRLLDDNKGWDKDKAEWELGKMISKLGLNARDAWYIMSWWSASEDLETEGGMVHLPRTEHPKGIDDIRKLYAWIDEQYPDMGLTEEDADRTYSAALLIQNLRRRFLKKDMPPQFRDLQKSLNAEIDRIIDKARSFRVDMVRKLKVKREVESFRLITDLTEAHGW